MTGNALQKKPRIKTAQHPPSHAESWDSIRHPLLRAVRDLAVIAGILIAASLIGLLFFSLGFSDANIITIFILGVLVTAVVTSRHIYGAITSLFSVLIFNYLFTEPRFTLHAYSPEYPFTFFVMFAASLITSSLTTKIKAQAVQQSQRASLTETLLETSQMLQQAENREEIIDRTGRQMVRMLGRNIHYFRVANEGTHLEPPHLFSADETPVTEVVAKAVTDDGTHEPYTGMHQDAERYLQHLMAGTSHEMLHQEASGLYLAVRSNQHVLAVVSIPNQGERPLDTIEKNLSISMLGECALALEKNDATMTRNRAELEARQEQLRANLLRTISHDLRTPLTSISGNASLLLETSGQLSERRKTELMTDIRDDAEWLNGIVENLLSVSRVENGSLNLKREPELVEEVVREACRHFAHRPLSMRIQVRMDQDLLMAWMDSRLIVQVLVNLLDNAQKYVPDPSPVTISAARTGDRVEVRVTDQGKGIPDESKNLVFDMFVSLDKARADFRRGLGLGLYLCRMIIQAHEGRIWVEDNTPSGASFCFTLPAKEVADDQAENPFG